MTEDLLSRLNRQYSERKEAMETSPEKAFQMGLSYSGPAMPDKGKKNGSCNRSACQLPLAGKLQYWMKEHTIENGRLYYCEYCELKFRESDKKFKGPMRCTADEDNALLRGLR